MKNLAAITSSFAVAIAMSGCASIVGGHNPSQSVETKRNGGTVAQDDHNPRSHLTASERSYTHPGYHWSIAYSADWRLDSANPDSVRLLAPGDIGLCGIHSSVVRFKTVEDFADFMEAFYANTFKARGVTVRSSPRKEISLPDNVSGDEIVHDILSGGKSWSVYVLAGGVGYVIDCETYVKDWKTLKPSFA